MDDSSSSDEGPVEPKPRTFATFESLFALSKRTVPKAAAHIVLDSLEVCLEPATHQKKNKKRRQIADTVHSQHFLMKSSVKCCVADNTLCEKRKKTTLFSEAVVAVSLGLHTKPFTFFSSKDMIHFFFSTFLFLQLEEQLKEIASQKLTWGSAVNADLETRELWLPDVFFTFPEDFGMTPEKIVGHVLPLLSTSVRKKLARFCQRHHHLRALTVW